MSNDLYNSPLFTDFYQLTMLQVYYQYGLHNTKVTFDYFFRNYPDYGGQKGGYCIFAGLEPFCKWLRNLNFTKEQIDLLKSSKSASGSQLFSSEFLNWLYKNELGKSLTLYSFPEGRIVHVSEPIIRVEADMATAQLLESSLLNHCNFQTLIATKASRIREAGERRPLIEFGMRRAHGTGANGATRAALIGGADFTSNTGVSYNLKFPPKGTHAHSLVQLFIALGEGEFGAFKAYAEIYPDDCILLVDTVNTLESGIPNAIKIFESLRKKGHEPKGIRLDSGDLAYLAIKAASMLDKAGFSDTSIVISNNIDELVLMQVLKQIRDEARAEGMDPQKIINRLVYGVGTSLVTSQGHSSLDGVYKLSAIFKNSSWIPSLKISETPEKSILPGNKNVIRIYDKEPKATADLICLGNENLNDSEKIILRHPVRADLFRVIPTSAISKKEYLLECIIRNGELIYSFPDIEAIRKIREFDIDSLDLGVRRLLNPHIYHVSVSEKLFQLKTELISAKGAR
jgi:nicotinate phosphoribosyltransferase